MCLEQGKLITCSEHYCLTLYSKTPIYLKPRFTADVLFPPKPAVNQGFTVIKIDHFPDHQNTVTDDDAASNKADQEFLANSKATQTVQYTALCNCQQTTLAGLWIYEYKIIVTLSPLTCSLVLKHEKHP